MENWLSSTATQIPIYALRKTGSKAVHGKYASVADREFFLKITYGFINDCKTTTDGIVDECCIESPFVSMPDVYKDRDIIDICGDEE